MLMPLPHLIFWGSDLPPVLTGLGTINPVSIQLRLGNELLPQQPMI